MLPKTLSSYAPFSTSYFLHFCGFLFSISRLDSFPNSGKRYSGHVQSLQTTQEALCWRLQTFDECLTAPRHPPRKDFHCSMQSCHNTGDHHPVTREGVWLLDSAQVFWMSQQNMKHMRLQLFACSPCKGELHKPQGNWANLFVKSFPLYLWL